MVQPLALHQTAPATPTSIDKAIEDISTIKQGAGLKTIRIKYGNGSKGNRGANNRGNAFETAFNALFSPEELYDPIIAFPLFERTVLASFRSIF